MTTAYVRRQGRLALYRRAANTEHWEANWRSIPTETLRHSLRPTRRLGGMRAMFRRWLPRDGIVLEAGCGTGLWVQRLRQNEWNCIGLDYAVHALQRSKALYTNLPLLGGDLFRLPFQNNSLTAYVSFGVVEHFVEGPRNILEEAVRVLRPGGIALISVPSDSFARRNLTTISEGEALARGLQFYQYYFTRAEFRRELMRAGLNPKGRFWGYGVNAGLEGPFAFAAPWVRRMGAADVLLDFVPGLPRLAAHMMMTAAIKPSVDY